MKTKLITLSASLSLVMASVSLATAAEKTEPAAAQPSADSILKQMSKTLAASKKFTFTADRELNAPFAKQQGLQQQTKIEVAVKRPNQLATRAKGKGDSRAVYADGKQLSLYDLTQDVYSTVPAQTSLDRLPGMLASKYGFVPPLTEIIVSDPYKGITHRCKDISYLGTGKISSGFLGLGATECHRLSLKGKLADAELWIGIKDHLPKRLVATLKGGSGGGKCTLNFSNWNTSADLSDQDFVFTPTKDSIKAPMMTLSEIRAAHKK